jgi:hypothetical protein
MENTQNVAKKTYEMASPEWLREAAQRHERNGETAWAILYRNDAIRIEEGRVSQ